MEPDRDNLIADASTTQSIQSKLIDTNHQQYSTSSTYKGKKPFQETWIRWVGCFLCSVYMFGRFYAFSTPTSMQKDLIKQLDIDGEEYNWFYSAYSLPNFVMPLLGGYFADKIGLRFCVILFISLLVLGQTLFWLGCATFSYTIALTGRFIFGIGGETVLMLNTLMIIKWFKKKEQGLAMSAPFFGCRLGSFLNSIISAEINQQTGSIALPSFMGLLMCLLSFGAAIVWVTMDTISDKRIAAQKEALGESLDENDRVETNKEQVSFKAIFGFRSVTWVAGFVAATGLAVFESFMAVANDFLDMRYNISNQKGGQILSIYYLVSGVITPIFGKIVDKVGNKANFTIFAALCQVIGVMLLLVIPSCDNCDAGIIPLVVMGGYLGIFSAAFWPCIVFFEDKKYIGLVTGLLSIFFNISEFLAPIGFGLFLDHTDKWHGYYWAVVFELGIAMLCFLGSLVFQAINVKLNIGLNKVQKSE